MARPWVGWTVLGVLLWGLLFPSEAHSEDPKDQKILASGQLSLGTFYRDRTQRRLSVDPFDQVVTKDAQFKGESYQAKTTFDLHAENSLSDDVILDFSDRMKADFYSLDDIQGGRFRFVDNLFRTLWGISLDPETTMKADFLLHTYQDHLLPELDASTGELRLTFDSEIERGSWLTFDFQGQATLFDQSVSDNYFEGTAKLLYQTFDPRVTRLDSLPAPVSLPHPTQSQPDGFLYSGELGLHESKKLFPLGEESMIGQSIASPLKVSPYDRLFRERIVSDESLSGVELLATGRRYKGSTFSNLLRLGGSGFHRRRVRRGLFLELSDAAGYTTYKTEDTSRLLVNHYDNRLKIELTWTRDTSQYGLYGAYGIYRFPDFVRLNLDSVEAGYRTLHHFGRRYWIVSDMGFVTQKPRTEQSGYSRQDQGFFDTVFRVDFSPIQSLSLSFRYAKIRVPEFETFFDSSYTDQTCEMKYHHQVWNRVAVESGVRYFDREAKTQPDNNRTESMVFLNTILDL